MILFLSGLFVGGLIGLFLSDYANRKIKKTLNDYNDLYNKRGKPP
jgi:hypothetical protein